MCNKICKLQFNFLFNYHLDWKPLLVGYYFYVGL